MTDNESTREDRDRYRRTSKDRDEYGGDAHAGEQGGYDRESSREEYKGGYDPGFLAG